MANLNLDKLLKKYKLEQKDLAESTGINKNTISKYCNNKFENINRNHVSLICKYFKCTPNDIFEIDDTVEVTPAKILYYDDKTNEFSYGEIAHAVISPLPWIGSKIVKGINESKTNLPVENSVEETEVFEEPDTYYSEEFEDPIATMSPEELANYTKTVNEYQIRFNYELKLDESISDLINKILDLFVSTIGTNESLIQILKKYKKYDYFTTNAKVNKCYKMLHAFAIEYLKDVALAGKLIEINDIYSKGGLDKLSDEKLNEMQSVVEYYLNNDLSKQKD